MSRSNQKARTRKDLLEAAARLVKRGLTAPSLDDIAAEASVSRATAYRYFSNVESLLVEASLDVATPQPADLFREGLPDDPVSRALRVDAAFHEMALANEASLRLMLAHAVQRPLQEPSSKDIPRRQNRRTPLIEMALEPLRSKLKPSTFKTLTQALALVVGTEAMVVCKDVLRLSDEEAKKMKQWVVRTLIEGAARTESRRGK